MRRPRLNALYYSMHHHCLVPRHLEDDLKRIRDLGAEGITIAALEQDLDAAAGNLDRLFSAVEDCGLEVHVAPSRWAGLVAGSPKVPSSFAARHPGTWSLEASGQPVFQGHVGPVCSLFHPSVADFFEGEIRRWARAYPVAGFVWDEVKPVDFLDHHPLALEAAGGGGPSAQRQLEAAAGFFDRMGRAAADARPGVRRSMFLYAHCGDAALEVLGAIGALDAFGCDGRPWPAGDAPADPEHRADKSLITQGPRFLDCAKRNGKESLFLLENHNFHSAEADASMDRHLPELLAMGPDHLLFYYCARNTPDPEGQLAILAKHFRP